MVFHKYWCSFSSLSTASSRNSVSVCHESILITIIQSPILPRTTINSACGNNSLLQEESEVPSSPEDIASSDQEIDQEPDQKVTFNQSKAQQAIPTMFLPFIEGL